MILTIESLSKNPNLLPNVTLGYDIRDFCTITALAMQITYHLVRDGDPVFMSNSNLNRSAIGNTTEVGAKPIGALVGPSSSATAILLGSLLQVANIPAMLLHQASNIYKNVLVFFFYKGFYNHGVVKTLCVVVGHFFFLLTYKYTKYIHRKVTTL